MKALATVKTFGQWSWLNIGTGEAKFRKRSSIIKVNDVVNINDPVCDDFSKCVKNPICLITGDGGCLPDDVREFESWDLPHDLFCVNRSMLYFKRQIQHWAAVDFEEGMWFAENINKEIEPEHKIVRHTVGIFRKAFDVFWQQDVEFDNNIQRRVWIGNSGLFAIFVALKMGYEKVVIAGMPLDNNPHWYEPNSPDSPDGPQWHGLAFANWIDFKRQRPDAAEKVKSMGGYTEFILGQASKQWLEGDT